MALLGPSLEVAIEEVGLRQELHDMGDTGRAANKGNLRLMDNLNDLVNLGVVEVLLGGLQG